jgi:hypothetical protein
MYDNYSIIFILFIIIFFQFLFKSNAEGLSNKPSGREKELIIAEILDNKHLFKNGRYEKAKARLAWLDVITFEELRMLEMKNNLTASEINLILS